MYHHLVYAKLQSMLPIYKQFNKFHSPVLNQFLI